MKNSESKRDDGVELESQLILRMPEEPARVLRDCIREGANSLKDRLTVKIENDMRYGEVRLDHWLLHAKIVDVPTIVESLKTIDGKSFYKTADVCQLVICKDEPDAPTTDDEQAAASKQVKKKDPNKVDKKYLWPHGITPPCKNIRKRRFRKTLKKKFVEAPEIEKEVKRLLRADNEAVRCTWDLVTDDQQPDGEHHPHRNIQSLQNELGMPDKDDRDDDAAGGTSSAGGGGGASGRSAAGKRNKFQSGRGGGGDGGGSDSQHMPRDIDIFGEDLSSSDGDDDDDDDDDDERHNINVELDETSRLSADDSRMSDDYSRTASRRSGMAGSSSAQQQDKLVTEFNKHMFAAGGAESDDQSESTAAAAAVVDVNARVAQLRRQLAELGQQRVQKEAEIASTPNQALRQRLQDTLDQMLGQILDREIELADLQSSE